jgi:alkylation response protein AidB-like acyl-CoA dehydrogenase
MTELIDQASHLDDVLADVDTFLEQNPPEDTVEFLQKRFDAGLASIDWPVGLGGRGLPRAAQAAIEARFEAAGGTPPRQDRNVIGLGMAAPTILAFGTREQQERWLRPLWTGEEIWCQLFSEPGAGSDLASLGTSAVRDGDEWVVNGQKVWTSLAHDASWALLVTRTDPTVPKHAGMTYFVCDMHAPGVDVRPLRQITGEAEFNEVFLTDVHVPDTDRLGDVGEGWKVTNATLMNERVSIAQGGNDRETGIVSYVFSDWRAGSRDPGLRDRVIDLWLDAERARLLTMQLAQMSASGTPGPEGSGLKLVYSELQQEATSAWVEVRGEDSLRYGDWTMRRPVPGDLGEHGAPFSYLRMRANTIEGGSSEILRNIISERVLGLPSEHRVDRDVAWKDMPR